MSSVLSRKVLHALSLASVRKALQACVCALAGAFAIGALKRARNKTAWTRKKFLRARRGRVGPSSWALTLARKLQNGELEAIFQAEERLWKTMTNEVARSPSAAELNQVRNRVSREDLVAEELDVTSIRRAQPGARAAPARQRRRGWWRRRRRKRRQRPDVPRAL